MCGRYALSLRAAQVRQRLQDDNMPVWDAPEDEGEGAPRQTYNFAPGNNGMVYRADIPDGGADSQSRNSARDGDVRDAEVVDNDDDTIGTTIMDDGYLGKDGGTRRYKLQTMKWGLVPFWTKRKPDYGSMIRTINCRSDSLAQPGGLWASMKARKRCIVVAQGFYEWLKKDGSKEKVPHYVKRKDGKLMCFAGLWDAVQYENEDQKLYTYTIITTESNSQLSFLHDRMPVILENGSEEMQTWLDPTRREWTRELQGLMRPSGTALECYPVTKEVGKVGNNAPHFIIPVDSKENKHNIANFFANAGRSGGATQGKAKKEETGESEVKPMFKKEEEEDDGINNNAQETNLQQDKTQQPDKRFTKKEEEEDEDDEQVTKLPLDYHLNTETESATKRRLSEVTQQNEGDYSNNNDNDSQDMKKLKTAGTSIPSPQKTKPPPPPPSTGRPKISATSNGTASRKSPAKKKNAAAAGTQKITKFFGK